ncbi:phage tail sheath subtilisin-like domain-containing protein [Ancylobacter sp. Lp-2]|uniref:phage tail sheath C-terminal domain-containing protein n=1 Tax=Ancylobacter sp. Lp-2 TaxID=2881339 RepID=UPI001E43FD4D|nr:phage tail sheath C-terminal domain-containing protein [Ancylobacter sp. Lp-2]MCB4768042.1 phage tail sheath subtilisin-like domain-containing protein [Ancylobacter sp. Lp-2]
MYKHPGVYIEHVPSGLLAIEAASTSVAAFIGPVKRGPVGEPVFITSVSQFALQFGLLNDGTNGIRDEGDNADSFGHAVNAFFGNGGNKAYIVRVAEASGGNAPTAATAAIPNPESNTTGFLLTAKSPGAWANDIIVRLSTTDTSTVPDLDLGYTLRLGVLADGKFQALEVFSGLQFDAASPRSLEKVVSEQSALATLKPATIGTNPGEIQVIAKALQGVATTLPTALALGGKKLDVKIGDSPKFTIEFAEDSGDANAIAALIQSAARANPAGSPEFAVTVSGGNAFRLASKIAGPAGNVSSPSGTARTLLGLGAGVTAVDDSESTLPTGTSTIEGFFDDGTDGTSAPAKSAYDTVFETLRDYRDVSIVLLPGKAWIEAGDNSVIEAAITHSEFMQNRMVIVDPPVPVGNDTLVSPKDVKDLGAPTSPYTALYYPWLNVGNPHYNPDTAANKPKTFLIPPSAFAAGMWARIDTRRGVWKAPAGLEADVRGTLGPNILIGNDLQDNLNELGINCLRAIIGPTVVWGARTLATKTKPEYRYVSVRRTQNMIGESLYAALQSVVFEPNDHRLWASLRASVTAFMDGLFRAGAFQGEKASDAYFVQCGLGSTMTQGDIDAGIVRVAVGFAALKPAEFVVVQIKQIVGQNA